MPTRIGLFWYFPDLSPFFGYANFTLQGTGFCFLFLCKGRGLLYFSTFLFLFWRHAPDQNRSSWKHCSERLNSGDLLIPIPGCGREGLPCSDHIFKKLFQLDKSIIAEKNARVNLAYSLCFSCAIFFLLAQETTHHVMSCFKKEVFDFQKSPLIRPFY